MGRKAEWALASVPATIVVGFVGAAAAALDEFARLPFYHVMAAAAALACVGSLTVLLRGQYRPASLVRGLLRLVPSGLRVPRDATPTVPNVGAALQKTHSVSWDFPVGTPAAGPVKQEASVNYEIRS